MPKATQTPADPTWNLIHAIMPHVRRALLWGPPGTGKTYAALHSGIDAAKPVYNLTLTDETPSAEARGMFIPADGRFVWRHGPVVLAMTEGSTVILNEINRASGDMLSFLLAATDDTESCRLTLPTGETISPSPGYRVLATSNEPPSSLPEALRDRFVVNIHVTQIAPAALMTLKDDTREVVLAAQKRILDAIAAGADVPEVPLLRACREFDRLRAHVGEQMAAQACFGAGATDVLTAFAVRG